MIRPIFRSRRPVVMAALLSAPLFAAAAGATELTPAQVKTIVDTFAKDATARGEAVGVAVGVVKKNSVVATSAYGLANVGAKTPFSASTIFEIGSNTKVFTTALLGLDVVNHHLALDTTLGQLSARVGATQPLTQTVRLKQLADFTSGFPDYAPRCSTPKSPGCLPSSRPPASVYTVADFLDFFQNTVPMNYQDTPPGQLKKLPAPYVYSDFSVGLLGLILANSTGAIRGGAVDAWFDRVSDDVLTPLTMSSTYLNVPSSVPPDRIAAGYNLATATAHVFTTGPKQGEIKSISVGASGGSYAAAPTVTISGGGGHGAVASAEISNGAVTSIVVTNPGADYIPPPSIVFNNGGASTEAKARAIISGGKVVAVTVEDGGVGYTQAPTVTISGGRSASGSDATGTAHIANGVVTAVTVGDGGSGYLPPLQVVVAPPAGGTNVIPVWAPAGALVSTVDDLDNFAMAAIGEPTVDGKSVPSALTAAFKMAEEPYACYGSNPMLTDCPASTTRSALSWEVIPADTVGNDTTPKIVTKNGGLTGFSSQILLVPSDHLAVVVLMSADIASAPAATLAKQIAYALIYAGE